MTFGVKHVGSVPTATAERVSYFESPVFRGALTQGLSVLLGGLFGLCVWISFQADPVIKPYHFELSLLPPVTSAVSGAAVLAGAAPTPAATRAPDSVSAPAATPAPDSVPASTTPPSASAVTSVPTPTPVPSAASTAGTGPATVAPATAANPVSPSAVSAAPNTESVPTPAATGASPAPVSTPATAAPSPAASVSAPMVPESSTTATPAVSAEAAPSVPKVPTVAPRASATLPVAGLFENKPPYGPLPIVRARDHVRPFDVYRQTFDPQLLAHPLVAVVVSDFGLSDQATEGVLQFLPIGVSVVLSNLAAQPAALAQKAYDKGFEIWMDLAVEPVNYPSDDPGANALFSNASIDQNQEALLKQLGAFTGYAGVFVAHASPYLSNDQDGDFLSRALFDRGVGMVVHADKVDPIFAETARKQKAPFFQGAMIAVDDSSHAVSAMMQAETAARKNGYSILIVPPQKGVRLMLEGWMKSLQDKGIALAPLSVVAERGLTLMTER